MASSAQRALPTAAPSVDNPAVANVDAGRANRPAAGELAADRDPCRIAAEHGDVLVNPTQRRLLIHQAEVPSPDAVSKLFVSHGRLA